MITRPYRPACGAEGYDFIDSWCGHCQRDENEDCPIVAASFAFDIRDPNYPKEWVQDDVSGPRCTAFAPYGEPIPYRCTDTLDMLAMQTRERGE